MRLERALSLSVMGTLSRFVLGADDYALRRVTGTSATLAGPMGSISLQGITVRVFDNMPEPVDSHLSGRSEEESDEDDERSSFISRAYPIAERVTADFIEQVRIQDQPWLGLHGQRPEFVGDPMVSDARGDHWLTVEGVPTESEGLHSSAYVKQAIGTDRISSFVSVLDNDRFPVPLAEGLLADALNFAWRNPPDLQRAVLMGAISCVR